MGKVRGVGSGDETEQLRGSLRGSEAGLGERVVQQGAQDGEGRSAAGRGGGLIGGGGGGGEEQMDEVEVCEMVSVCRGEQNDWEKGAQNVGEIEVRWAERIVKGYGECTEHLLDMLGRAGGRRRETDIGRLVG